MALKVQIDQLVNSLTQVKPYQPIIECIINSLEASATNINVSLSTTRNEDAVFDEWIVDKITVKDDGEGFTKRNVDAFKEYRTKNKIHLGCKGVGRLTWLKIFYRAEINSIVKENEKVIAKKFLFDEEYDYSLDPETKEVPSSTKLKTSITFDKYKDENEYILGDPKKIRDIVLVELLPKLLLLEREFCISFENDRPGVEKQLITASDLPELVDKTFYVSAGDKKEEFILKYYLPDGNGDGEIKTKTFAYYCANKRAVETFNSKDLTVNLDVHRNQYGIFLLESKIFDERVNDTRNRIIINDDDLYEPFSWDNINENLRPVLKEIIYGKWPKLEEEASAEKAKLMEANPHLSHYIKKFNVVGCLVKKEALKSAEKQFDYAKRQVRRKYEELLRVHKVEERDVIEFKRLAENTTEVGKQELAEYIWYRKIVIDVMNKLIQHEESYENVIHNLIMPMKSRDTERTEDNNLWLLDDKYSLYQYAASDLEIQQICVEVQSHIVGESQYKDEQDRPDLCIFFSDSKESDDDLEAVIIELKSFSTEKYEKSKGLDQLPLYADSLKRRNPKFKKFWVYLVVDEIDDEFKRLLKLSRNYKPFFSHNGETYLLYNEEAGAYIAVLTMKSLVANAEARNHRFLKIVQSGSLGN